MRDEDEMAVDEGEMDDSSEHIPETKITVVGEIGLDSTTCFPWHKVLPLSAPNITQAPKNSMRAFIPFTSTAFPRHTFA